MAAIPPSGDPPSPDVPAPSGALDLPGVLADIETEVRARRASGELTAEFERHLDTAFAELAPVDAIVGDLHDLLAKLQASTTIDTRAPIESVRRGVPQLKGVVARAIDWELRYLASQVSGLANAITRALFIVSDRLDDLDHDAVPRGDRALAEIATRDGRSRLPDGPWETLVTEILGAAEGRVLHAECERGALVAALRDRGVDAYGVDPVEQVVVAARLARLQPGDARAHLRTLDPGSLSGVVLTGAPDRLAAAALADLLALSARAVGSGGHLVLIAHSPGPGGAADLGAELAGRARIDPQTFVALAEHAGFIDVGVRPGPADAAPGGFALLGRR